MRRRSAQAIVEFALILPLLLLLVLGIIDLGLVIQQYMALEHGARSGARLAAIGADLSAVSLRVADNVGGRWTTDELTVTISSSDHGTYIEVTVDVTAPVKLLTPLAGFVEGLSSSWEARASASFRME